MLLIFYTLVFSQGYNRVGVFLKKKKFIQKSILINVFSWYFYSYFLEVNLLKCLNVIYQTWGNGSE